MENFQSAYIIFLNNVENLDSKEQNNSPLNSRWANWSSASRLLHSTQGGLKNILEPKIFGHLCAVGQIYGEVVGCYEIRQELFTLSFAISDPAIFHLFPCFYSVLVQRLLWLWERNMQKDKKIFDLLNIIKWRGFVQLPLLKPGIVEMGFYPRLAKMADLTHYAPREPIPQTAHPPK